MDLKQLLYFVTIVDEGNISNAAKRLFMSQPPLTNQMKLLEEELNTTLFIRGSRSITLTDSGRLLYEKAKIMISLSDITISQINDLNNYEGGNINLGVVSSVSLYLTSRILNDFCLNHPNIKFSLTEDNTYKLLTHLQNKTIDIALIRTPFDNKGYEMIPLKSEKIVIVGKKLYKDLTLEEISKEKYIIYRRWENIIKSTFLKNKLNFDPYFINDNANTSLNLALNGLGIALVPESIVEANNIKNYYYIKDFNLATDITLVYDKNNYLSHASKLLIDYLKNDFRKN